PPPLQARPGRPLSASRSRPTTPGATPKRPPPPTKTTSTKPVAKPTSAKQKSTKDVALPPAKGPISPPPSAKEAPPPSVVVPPLALSAIVTAVQTDDDDEVLAEASGDKIDSTEAPEDDVEDEALHASSPPSVNPATASSVGVVVSMSNSSSASGPPPNYAANDDWVNDDYDDAKSTTDIERILDGTKVDPTEHDDGVTTPREDGNADDDDDEDFKALMAFDTSPRADEPVAATGPDEAMDDQEDDGQADSDEDDDDINTDLDEVAAACRIQKLFKMYSHRRDSMEFHREVQKKHRTSLSGGDEEDEDDDGDDHGVGGGLQIVPAFSKTSIPPVPINDDDDDDVDETYSEPAGSEGQVTPSTSDAALATPVTKVDVVTKIKMEEEEQQGAAAAIQKAFRRSSMQRTASNDAETVPTDQASSAGDDDDEVYSELNGSEGGQVSQSNSDVGLVPTKPTTSAATGETTQVDQDAAATAIQKAFRKSVVGQSPHDAKTPIVGNASSRTQTKDVDDDDDNGDGVDETYSDVAASDGQVTPSASRSALRNGNEDAAPTQPSDGQQAAAAAAIQKAYRRSVATPHKTNDKSPTEEKDDEEVDSNVGGNGTEGVMTPSASESAIARGSVATVHSNNPTDDDKHNAASAIQKAFRKSTAASVDNTPTETTAPGATVKDIASDDEIVSDRAEDRDAKTRREVETESSISDQEVNGMQTTQHHQERVAAATIQKAYRRSSICSEAKPSDVKAMHAEGQEETTAKDVSDHDMDRDMTTRREVETAPSISDQAVNGMQALQLRQEEAAAAAIQKAYRRSSICNEAKPSDVEAIHTEVMKETTARNASDRDKDSDAKSSKKIEPASFKSDQEVNGMQTTQHHQEEVAAAAIQKAYRRSSICSEAKQSDEKAEVKDVSTKQEPKEVVDPPSKPREDKAVPPTNEKDDAARAIQNAYRRSTNTEKSVDARKTPRSMGEEEDKLHEVEPKKQAAASPRTGDDDDDETTKAARAIQQTLRQSPLVAPNANNETTTAPPLSERTTDSALLYDITTPRDDEFDDDDRSTVDESGGKVDKKAVEAIISGANTLVAAAPPVSQGPPPSTADQELIESVMGHLNDFESDDDGGDGPLSYEDEFMDDDDEDDNGAGGGISEDAHALAD
ncbi:hypothetical protein As57867_016937, partial [Aphanomyces stellatus]